MKRLVLLAFIWGWAFLLIKVSVGGMTPTTVAFSRVALGAAVLVVACRVRGVTVPSDAGSVRHYALTALVGLALPFTLLAWGEERITSALTSVVNASTPLFTAVVAAFVFSERLRGLQRWGLALGALGVGVAAGVGGDDLAHSSVVGVAAAVGTSACYGVAFNYARRHLTAMPAEAAATGQLLAGSALLAPFAVVTSLTEGVDLPLHRVVAIVLLGTVGTGLGYVLYYRIVADLGATGASLITYLMPVVAVTVGVVFLDEPFSFRLVVGGALVVVGIAAVQGRHRWAARPPVGAAGLLLAVAVVAAVAACGGDAAGGSGCGPDRRERLDPGSAVHLLPGAPEPEYLSDPPTSGPHRVGPPAAGVQAAPLDRPAQVQVLEAGGILFQHEGLPDDERARLEALASDEVVVAPGQDLPAPVVATAWGAKRTCDGVVEQPLADFVADHVGGGAEHG